MDNINSDVKESIAGYYYQLLLATQELINLYSERKIGAVAIEKGADIRIQSDEDLYIEAKFYGKEKFSKKDQAITRTIYNFAIKYSEKVRLKEDLSITKFEFKTNIELVDILFFKSWNSDQRVDDEVVKYVQYCLIKESKKIKTSSYEHINKLIDNNEIKENIKEEAFLNNEQILDYASKVVFNSEKVKEIKEESIKTIYADINNKLSIVDDYTALQVRNKLIEIFFNTTLRDSNDFISTKRIDALIRKDTDYKLQYLEDKQIEKDISIVEETIDDFKGMLDSSISIREHNQIIRDLRKNLTIVIDESRNTGSVNQKGKYLLTNTNYDISNIVVALQPFSQFVVKTKGKYGSTKITDLKESNNIGFTNHKNEYMLKSGVNDIVNKKTNSIFKKFIDELISNHSIQTLDHTEGIYFYSNGVRGEKPCDIDNHIINELVYDISDPNPENIQAMLMAQDFRCTHCLEYNENGCHYSNNLERKKL